MIKDWKEEIAIAWLVKQAMMELDKKKLFPYHLPELAANEEQLSQAEKHLGHNLDPRYKEFLRRANGWHGFWHTVDLSGTNDLIEGPRRDTGEYMLSMLDDGVLEKNGLKRSDLLPIASTKFDRDLFVITRPSSRIPGLVIWFAGEEVDRFSTFDDYFLAMVEYAREDMQWFRTGRK